MNCRRLLFALLGTGLALPVFADDLVPPPWTRGAANTTTQEWVFNTGNPGAPDGFINGLPGNAPYWNPNGVPSMQLSGGTSWAPTGPQGRTGVWAVSSGALQFTIPNTPQSFTNHKEVWAQVTYFTASPTSVVSLTPFGPASGTATTVQDILLPDFWRHATFHFTLDFNPTVEYFQIINNQSGAVMFVDQVVIDTICVPEPATVFAVGIGLVALAARRRRKP